MYVRLSVRALGLRLKCQRGRFLLAVWPVTDRISEGGNAIAPSVRLPVRPFVSTRLTVGLELLHMSRS